MPKTKAHSRKIKRLVRRVTKPLCPETSKPQKKNRCPERTRGTARQTPRTRQAVAAASSSGNSGILKQVPDAQSRKVVKKRALEEAVATSSSVALSISGPPSLEIGSNLQTKPSSPQSEIDQSKISEAGDQPVSRKKKEPIVIPDHIEILNDNPPMYRCNFDGKQFKTKAHIKYHLSCQKGDADKPFLCDQCGRGFIAKSHFEYHERTHTGERPYICRTCGKNFPQKGKLTRHMTTHTGERRFKCQECDKGFTDSQALKIHMRTHTGERPFACTNYDKRFGCMASLKKHLVVHTGERSFKCGICDKSFGLKWTLAQHLRTHLNKRTFQCQQCHWKFVYPKDLHRHQLIHSGERPFKCGTCPTAFPRKDNRDRHVRNVHDRKSKKPAGGAAADYLKTVAEPQSLADIPTPRSKVSSIVGLNEIKEAELRPHGPSKQFKSVGPSSSKSLTSGRRISTTRNVTGISTPTLPVEKEGNQRCIPEQEDILITAQNGSQEGDPAANVSLICPSVPESIGVGAGLESMGENEEASKGERSFKPVADEDVSKSFEIEKPKCFICGEGYQNKTILAEHFSSTHCDLKKTTWRRANDAAAQYLKTAAESQSSVSPRSKTKSPLSFDIPEWMDPATSALREAQKRVSLSKFRRIRAKRWACKTLRRVAIAKHLRLSKRPSVEIETDPTLAQVVEERVSTLLLITEMAGLNIVLDITPMLGLKGPLQFVYTDHINHYSERLILELH